MASWQQFSSMGMALLTWLGIALAAIAIAIPVWRNHRLATPSWPALLQDIRQAFPDVQHITTSELAEWLASDRPPILLDIRMHEEYAISAIPTAQLATTVEDALALLHATPRGQGIVVYCSVGYRSSAVAKGLQAAGFQEVYNLEGSIFTWANESRRLVRNGAATEEVHPFNRRWGQLLDRSLWPRTGW